MSRRSSRWLAVASIFSLVFLLAPISASAQDDSATPPSPASDTTSFVLNPVGDFPNGYFELDAEPGESTQLTAKVTNVGTLPVDLIAFAANAYNLPNGGFAAADQDEAPIDPTTWLHLPSLEFTLEPEEQREFTFDITVPADTESGQYVTAIVVRTQGELEIPGSDIYRQIIRSAMSVVITVPGDYPTSFELGTPVFNTSTAVRTLEVPVANTGRYVVRPEGTLEITDSDGNIVSTAKVEMGSVYGGNSTIVQVPVPEHLPFGDYHVSLNLADEATDTSASIEDVPVTLAAPEVEEPEIFTVDSAAVTPNGDPVQYADVAAVITNNGPAIPTANVILNVMRDGKEVENYPLAENQALPQGTTDFGQRYIPVDGWESGTYTFELVISAVSGDTETVIATVEIPDEITVP